MGDIWLANPANWLIVVQVALGLGMVIFVHELGHFAVAKWCGVKCEKFYLGFGRPIFRFQWGETEYGIGILPLGGYVKMLGQEDNPSRAIEETERARVPGEGGESAPAAAAYDPRSYLAKSVPQRMAIISAGVIMNVIFAFVMATVAYSMGVPEAPCVVGGLLPGEAAWRAGLQPGDRVLEIADIKNPRFRDLQASVMLGDNLDQGVRFVVERKGAEEPLEFVVVPDRNRLAPMIGMKSAHTTQLDKPPVAPNSPTSRLEPGFQPGDKVIAINGEEVEDFVDVERKLAASPGPITVTVRRQRPEQESEQLDIRVAGVPMKTLGLSMRMGPVVAIQKNSPADTAGIRPGDRITRVDGERIDDPLKLPAQLAARAGETVTLTIERAGRAMEKALESRPFGTYDPPILPEHPMTIPTLGIAYRVTNTIAAVEPGGPASGKGIQPGQRIVSARLIPPDKSVQKEYGVEQQEFKMEFDPVKKNWPFFFFNVQDSLPGTTVELTLNDERAVTLMPAAAGDWFNQDRGLLFKPLEIERKAESFGEALGLAYRETGDSLTQVYRFLRKLGGQISIKGVGGPIKIA
ncbi:MAG: site-2 protease family protein, partial [Pirellulales bacterium]